MIDTIKFKVPVTDKIEDAIRSVGYETKVVDKFYSFQESEKIMDQILVPPYQTPMTLRSSYLAQHYMLEGSMPKQLYGENVHLLYPSQLEEVLEKIYSFLLKRYGHFVHYEHWTLQRLDACYAWKLEPEVARRQIEFLKTLKYPRKGYHVYPTSVMWSSRVSTPKFYLKHPEFLIHGYRNLQKYEFTDLANKVLQESEGVLRYEVELHKPYLVRLFHKKESTYKDINTNLIYECLNKHLSMLFGTENRQCVNSKILLDALEKSCDKKTTKILFSFHSLHSTGNPVEKNFIKEYTDPSTIKRRLNKLSELGVGPVVDDPEPSKFELSIPSPKVINSDKPDPAAGGAGLSGLCNTA